MRQLSARWLLVIMLSAFFASLLTVGHGMFEGEAAESQIQPDTVPHSSPEDSCPLEPAAACAAGACCDEPTAAQLAEIRQIKQAVGINPFEGTLLSGVEPDLQLPLANGVERAANAAAEPKDVASLREAAHALETVAHALEVRSLYTQADEVRQLAVRLRANARKIR